MASLVLLTALPAFAQGAPGRWSVDVHRFSPSLSGDFQGSSGGNAFNVDLQNDLGLAKDSTKLGYSLEYQGPRFGLELSRDEQDYAGSKVVQQNIQINGQTFAANSLVNSSFKATNDTLNWTIRCFKLPQFWLGLDLGARATEIQLDANGSNALSGVQATANYKATLPVPQVGPALGFSAFDDRLVVRGFYHGLAYKGCTYSHPGVDLRYFPISWLGVRAFAEDEHFNVPKGSLKDDLVISLDRGGMGFGLVARF